MTLCFIHGYQEIREGPLAVDLGGEYLFSGATLTGNRLVPNNISWNIFFDLGVNTGIVVSPTDTALLVDGQVKKQVNHDLRKIIELHRPHKMSTGLSWQSPEHISRSIWPKIIASLARNFKFNESAQTIWSAMTKWERVSQQTLRRLVRKIGGVEDRTKPVQILVSGTRWILYYHRESKLVVGDSKNTWGETYLPARQRAIQFATPVKNGWFVEDSGNNKYLLLWDGNSVNFQNTVFPHGKWERRASWTFWPTGANLLTPIGQMVTVPEHVVVIGASAHWFFFNSSGKLLIVDQEGQKYTEEIPKQYGTNPALLIGNSRVLILHQENECCYVSLANVSDWPFEHCVWKSAASPSNVSCMADVIRSEPDVFIILFDLKSQNGVGVCFVDGWGRIGRYPIFLDVPFLAASISFEDLDTNQAVIEVFREQNELAKIKIGVLDSLVQIDMGEGVVINNEMIPTSGRENALLQILNDAF